MLRPFQVLLLLILLLIQFHSSGQPARLNRLEPAGAGLHFMYYDSSASKSTVVEFDHFLVLIEVPIADEGGGATHLTDHRAGGVRVLASLAARFPTKPLRYVVSSHWHPHSLSAVAPFLAAGCTLVTTRANWAKLRIFVEPAALVGRERQLLFVDGDSLVLRDRRQRLVTYRFQQKEYPATPTPDYLFTWLPNRRLLHCGCMFNRWTGPPVEGHELLTSREEDLNRFIQTKRLRPLALIRLPVETTEPAQLQPIAALDRVVATGLRTADLVQRFLRLPLPTLNGRRDSLATAVITGQVPPGILNSGVYQALGRRELDKALALAHLQALVAPADPNVWDTLGEVYFFLNQPAIAAHYEQQLRKLAPGFKEGGANVWVKDLAEHQQQWQAQK